MSYTVKMSDAEYDMWEKVRTGNLTDLSEELALTKQKLDLAIADQKFTQAKFEGTVQACAQISGEARAWKQRAEVAEKAIRESQGQEPIGYWYTDEREAFIGDYKGHTCSEPLYAKPVIIPQSAAQLHIKELREALVDCERHAKSMAVWGGTSWKYHPPQAGKIASSAANALAKQPDTRALEKALLEARINELESVNTLMPSGLLDVLINKYRTKLAGLNKV